MSIPDGFADSLASFGYTAISSRWRFLPWTMHRDFISIDVCHICQIDALVAAYNKSYSTIDVVTQGQLHLGKHCLDARARRGR